MSDDDDLFGSDLELDDQIDQQKSESKHEDSEAKGDSDDDLFGSDDEGDRAPSPDRKLRDVKPGTTPVKQRVFGPSKHIRRWPDHVRIGGIGTELCAAKMPTWMDAEREEFDAERVRQEMASCSDDVSHIAHKIRWRMMQDEAGNKYRESNARLVTWSDGSIQMLVGSMVFDIVKTPLPNHLHYLYEKVDVGDEQLQQCRANFTSKLLVKPAQNLVVRLPLRQKPAHASAQTAKKIVTTTDPEKEVQEKIRQYRLKEMRDSARERAQRFVPPPDSFSADFLEYSDADELSSEDEVPQRCIIDDIEMAERLQAAKKSEDVKGRAIIKKRGFFGIVSLFGVGIQSSDEIDQERKDKPVTLAAETEPGSEADEDVEVHHRPAAKRRHVIEESDSD